MNYGFYRKTLFLFAFLCCLCYGLWYCVPMASAVDADLIEDTSAETVSSDQISMDDNFNDFSSSNDTSVNVYLDPAGGQYRLTDIQTSVTKVSASDSNGFKAIVLGLIGDYEMVTKEYTYTSNNGYTTKQVTTESDYSWMISAGIFIIVVYCFLRILGGVICGRK